MASPMIAYDVPYIITEKKSQRVGPSPEMRRIARQLDTLQRMSIQARNDRWGSNWVQEMVDFLNLEGQIQTASPSFRPRVNLPEVQFLLMSEAAELTNDTPKTYISVNGKRDEPREDAFAAMWKLGQFNNRLFDGVLWSQLCNPGVVQVGVNPDGRGGRGNIWLSALDPETFLPDAHATNDRDWSYVGREDWSYVDDIKRVWGKAAEGIRQAHSYDQEDVVEDQSTGSGFDLSLELPPGPLRVDSPEGFEHQHTGARSRVRYFLIKDYARERLREEAGSDVDKDLDLLVPPKFRWKYPNGRFIAECQQWILGDGPNFTPRLPQDDFCTFPYVGIWSMPHLKHFYGPPPVRYGRGPQEIAEKMYVQLIENMIRTNNAMYWIPEESGIDVDTFGGLPGEVQVYRGDKPPTMNWPNAIPQHMTQVPEELLKKVARYLGSTPERQGQSGGGNISPDLFDAAVFQGQALLRMKARMLAESYTRVSQLAFYMMCRFKTTRDQLRGPRSKEDKAAVWSPVTDDDDVNIEMDETSLDVLSNSMMKSLVMALGKTGAIPNEFMLQTLGVPHAKEMAAAATRQQELAALARIRKPR
jgi:hypothetical protein